MTCCSRAWSSASRVTGAGHTRTRERFTGVASAATAGPPSRNSTAWRKETPRCRITQSIGPPPLWQPKQCHRFFAGVTLVPTELITQAILVLRGQKVLLDADLAELYGVETRRLNEQVRRNQARFPRDFAFQLTATEFDQLKSQFVTSSWGGRDKLPYACAEHGAIVAATILSGANSKIIARVSAVVQSCRNWRA